MSQDTWRSPFLGRLVAEGVTLREEPAGGLAPARLVNVEPEDWGRLARQAQAWGCRWGGGWAEDRGEELRVYACLEKAGGYLLARTAVPRDNPELSSHAPYFLGADRAERHTRDLYGIRFTDHPDPRRWTRHCAWGEAEFPLRRDFPAAGRPQPRTPPDEQYPFLRAEGGGVHEIPVGPVHAGIIEPGHFRFQAVGELVLNLEERLGYAHKGIEKSAEGRDAQGLARLAARVSGDTTVAHAWAACMAMEQAAGIQVPPRGLALRALMAERERVANHLGDIGAVCNDVAFAFGHYQFARLREEWQRESAAVFGHRFMMDRIVPGGVAFDLGLEAIENLRAHIAGLRPEITALYRILDTTPSLEDRLATTGVLDRTLARGFGALGYVGRASGLDFDVRRDAPYAPYERLKVRVPVYEDGDAKARVRVRFEEILVSLDLMDTLLAALPGGAPICNWTPPETGAAGLGLVEGWRGEILAFVSFAENGRVARYYPRDPSLFNWPALEKLVRGNIVADFPVCNKSINGSYSGNDL